MPRSLAAPELTRPAAIDDLLDRLAARREAWTRVGLAERVDYLGRCARGVLDVAWEWVDVSCRAKGIDPDSSLAGEEWISGPLVTVRLLRLLGRALERGGQPAPPAMRRGRGGQQIATVLPADVFDRIFFPGFRAEVWIEPGRSADQGRIYRGKAQGRGGPGKLGLVLGAGNVSSIAPTDALHKLFVEDQVVVLKMNPVNEYLGRVFSIAFRSLIADGFLGIVYGGKETGHRLCHDPRVETIHLTGSDRTHDAIVWGPDEAERQRRKAERDPLLAKPFTSELGCVTPVLVVPGSWSDGDVDFQARHVTAMVAHNASFNCNAAKVLLLPRDWGLRQAFVGRVQHHLARTPPRRAYYPGARERYRAFLDRYPAARPLGAGHGDDGTLPWTLIPDVPARRGEYALSHEAFCGVLALADVEASGADGFLERAVGLANEAVHGTLSAVMLVDPATQRAHRPAVARAIADLRYGGVGVNAWTGVNFGLGVTSWGAFPGHTPADIGSGVGAVHNAFLFDRPQKSVVYAPFRPRPRPAWFVDHRNLAELGRRLTEFEVAPSWRKVPGIVAAALRG